MPLQHPTGDNSGGVGSLTVLAKVSKKEAAETMSVSGEEALASEVTNQGSS